MNITPITRTIGTPIPLHSLLTTLNFGHTPTPPNTHSTHTNAILSQQSLPPLLLLSTKTRLRGCRGKPRVGLAFLTSALCMRQLVLRSLGVLEMKVSNQHLFYLPSSQLKSSKPKKKKVDFQTALSHDSSLAQANPYYPLPVPSPPWVHPSPSSDTTPPTNSPPSSLAFYATPVSPPAPIEPLLNNSVTLDARIHQDSTEDAESAPQSPRATRNAQAAGRRPGACSRCKKLKVCSNL